MRRRLHVRLLVVLALTIIAAACDESLSELAGPTPTLEPTFSSIQRDIFESTDAAGRVACVSCHTNVGRTPPVGLILLSSVSYGLLVSAPSTQAAGVARVIPGNPDDSYLIRKLEGRGISGLRMPRSGPPYLTSGQIQIIRRWIEIGAPNN